MTATVEAAKNGTRYRAGKNVASRGSARRPGCCCNGWTSVEKSLDAARTSARATSDRAEERSCMFVVGLDPGQRRDPSALAVVERVEPRLAWMPRMPVRLEVRYLETM